MRKPELIVLDSFALLAYLGNEPGAEPVAEILDAAAEGRVEPWLSVVNLGEILYITERERGLQAAQTVIATLDQLPLKVADADRPRTFLAAHIKARHAVSYADAFAIGLAHQVEGRVVTGDPEFEKVEDLVDIRWIGR